MRTVDGAAGARQVAVGARATYDAIAAAYDAQLGAELDGKPLDRALLDACCELADGGTLADVGCGPGHITRHLAARHDDVLGVDLSPAMVSIARRRAPDLPFVAGSMLHLPFPDDSWAGAVAMYSIIHLRPDERATACREMARVLRPGANLLVAFHIDSAEFAAGEANHLTDWFGESVELDGFFLDPGTVEADLEAAGFVVTARLQRQPDTAVEYPSRRCYLLARHP